MWIVEKGSDKSGWVRLPGEYEDRADALEAARAASSAVASESAHTCRVRLPWDQADTLDLHALIKARGIDEVADVLGIKDRALINRRAGAVPLTVEDLYRLETTYGGFELYGTVHRIGGKRAGRE
jgi:hypothetical protein